MDYTGNKKKEFTKRIEKLFQAGGMMMVKPNILFGKKVFTIHKVKMRKNGMCFNYSYFEEDFWGNAGFEKEHYNVFSNNIGYGYFHDVIVAALKEIGDEAREHGDRAAVKFHAKTIISSKKLTEGIALGILEVTGENKKLLCEQIKIENSGLE